MHSLDAQLIEAAQCYLDSKRLDKLDAWLHGKPEWPILVARADNYSIEAFPNGSGVNGPTAPTLRELIDEL